MSYKFIFDTNVIKSDLIDKLKNAGLFEVCNSGRFAFYFTPVLLKERLDFLLKGAVPETVKESIEFLVSLKWQKFFNDPNGSEGILTAELEGKLPSEHLFINFSQIRANLELVLQGGTLSEGAQEEIQRDKDRWSGQKQQNCIAYKEMREQINDHLRKNSSLPSRRGKPPMLGIGKVAEKLQIHYNFFAPPSCLLRPPSLDNPQKLVILSVAIDE